MVQVTFYYGNTGVQKVIWDTKKYEIKNPKKLAQEWASDLGATRHIVEKYND